MKDKERERMINDRYTWGMLTISAASIIERQLFEMCEEASHQEGYEGAIAMYGGNVNALVKDFALYLKGVMEMKEEDDGQDSTTTKA